MSKAIKRIKNYQEHFELSDRQTLYLIYKHFGISYNISAKDLIELIEFKVLGEDGDFIENLDTVTKLTSKDLVVVKPKFETELSKEVYKYFLKYTCYKNPYDNAPIPFDATKLTNSVESTLLDYKKETTKKLRNNKEFYNIYIVYLCLLPTSIQDNNTKWVSFYKSLYSGVNIRKRITTIIPKFLKVVQKRDSGVFLYSIYLFVRSGIKGDQTYIGSQSTFWAEWEDWYLAAQTAIDGASSIDELFRAKGKGSKHKGGVAL